MKNRLSFIIFSQNTKVDNISRQLSIDGVLSKFETPFIPTQFSFSTSVSILEPEFQNGHALFGLKFKYIDKDKYLFTVEDLPVNVSDIVEGTGNSNVDTFNISLEIKNLILESEGYILAEVLWNKSLIGDAIIKVGKMKS